MRCQNRIWQHCTGINPVHARHWVQRLLCPVIVHHGIVHGAITAAPSTTVGTVDSPTDSAAKITAGHIIHGDSKEIPVFESNKNAPDGWEYPPPLFAVSGFAHGLVSQPQKLIILASIIILLSLRVFFTYYTTVYTAVIVKASYWGGILSSPWPPIARHCYAVCCCTCGAEKRGKRKRQTNLIEWRWVSLVFATIYMNSRI